MTDQELNELISRLWEENTTYSVLGTVEELTRGAALVKAENEGRLIVLPCKAGDTLYTESPVKGLVTSFIAPDTSWILENLPEFGKTVFLTSAEAEAALLG